MLYPVDFSIKLNGSFQTIHSELIYASSVSECQETAKSIRKELPQHQHYEVHIFIEA